MSNNHWRRFVVFTFGIIFFSEKYAVEAPRRATAHVTCCAPRWRISKSRSCINNTTSWPTTTTAIHIYINYILLYAYAIYSDKMQMNGFVQRIVWFLRLRWLLKVRWTITSHHDRNDTKRTGTRPSSLNMEWEFSNRCDSKTTESVWITQTMRNSLSGWLQRIGRVYCIVRAVALWDAKEQQICENIIYSHSLAFKMLQENRVLLLTYLREYMRLLAWQYGKAGIFGER